MSQETTNNEVIRSIGEAISGLEFGEINITVHHWRVVKIERVERIRFEGVPEVAGKAKADKGGER